MRADTTLRSDDLPLLIVLVAACIGVAGLFSANPGLTLAAAATLVGFVALHARPGEPPVLLLALGLQWLQVVTQVLHANVLGLPVDEMMTDYGGDTELASWLSLIGLVLLALGIRLVLPRAVPGRHAQSLAEAQALSIPALWRLYLGALVAATVAHGGAWLVPGLTQPLLALAHLKWAAFFAFAHTCLVRNERLGLLALAFAIEFLLALGGYFAEFKTVFLVVMLALGSSRIRLGGRRMAAGLAVAGMLVAVSVVWSAVKRDYRNYLSGGTSAQIVLPGYLERTQFLAKMVSELTSEDLVRGAEDLAYRISYVQFFGRVLTHVPAAVPHEDGQITLSALQHVLVPRLVWPSKPPLKEDSEETRQYTGLLVAGEEEGSSVSIGYLAQLYVDYGRYGMCVAVLLLGCLWGLIYRALMSPLAVPLVFRHGLTVAVVIDLMRFETTLAKLLGGTITAFIAAWAVGRWIVPHLATHVLRPERPRRFRWGS